MRQIITYPGTANGKAIQKHLEKVYEELVIDAFAQGDRHEAKNN